MLTVKNIMQFLEVDTTCVEDTAVHGSDEMGKRIGRSLNYLLYLSAVNTHGYRRVIIALRKQIGPLGVSAIADRYLASRT